VPSDVVTQTIAVPLEIPNRCAISRDPSPSSAETERFHMQFGPFVSDDEG